MNCTNHNIETLRNYTLYNKIELMDLDTSGRVAIYVGTVFPEQINITTHMKVIAISVKLTDFSLNTCKYIFK